MKKYLLIVGTLALVLPSFSVFADTYVVKTFPVPYHACSAAWDNLDPPLDPCADLCSGGIAAGSCKDEPAPCYPGCDDAEQTQACLCDTTH